MDARRLRFPGFIHDDPGGSAPDPLVWDQGSCRKQRKVDVRVNVDLAALPGPTGFLHGPWMLVRTLLPGLKVLVCCAGSLHWPADCGDLGHFGLEVLILFEQQVGHRLLRPHERVHRHTGNGNRERGALVLRRSFTRHPISRVTRGG